MSSDLRHFSSRLSISFMDLDDKHLRAWHIEGRFDQFILQTAFLQSDHGCMTPDKQFEILMGVALLPAIL